MFTLIQTLILSIPKCLKEINIKYKEISILTSINNIIYLLKYCCYHSNLKFTALTELTAIDYLKKNNRYTLVYLLLSYKYNKRLEININCSDSDVVPSSTLIFSSSNWLEREVWDMFGIFFIDHPDLRRILTDYGFIGYPLRKDFPLSGYLEVRYDDEEKRITSEPVELSQEFRVFEFQMPWKYNGN